MHGGRRPGECGTIVAVNDQVQATWRVDRVVRARDSHPREVRAAAVTVALSANANVRIGEPQNRNKGARLEPIDAGVPSNFDWNHPVGEASPSLHLSNDGWKKTGARQKPLRRSISYFVVARSGRNETLAS